MSGHCLRCYCPDCDRDPAGEMHGHNCTDGTNCIEKARNDAITSLRARLAEAEEERDRLRAALDVSNHYFRQMHQLVRAALEGQS